MLTRRFWSQTAERAVKTAAQTAVAMLGASGVGLLDVDWVNLGSVVGLAALLSVLSSMASSRVGSTESPSLVP